MIFRPSSRALLFDVQDRRLEGIVHARVVRPPAYGAELEELDDLGTAQAMPGVLKVVRDASHLAVIAEREERAMKAAAALKKQARWSAGRPLPDSGNLPQHLRQLPARREQVRTAQDMEGALERAAIRLKASYTKPYLMHGSIGPSCAVAQMENDQLTVWTHSQGVYPLRRALAGLLRMNEEKIRAIGVQGSGCYGHNGADDVAADAAWLARTFPGRPVRVQWSREDEHGWEPYGSAMVMDLQAGLNDKGEINAWGYSLISDSHATRPRGQGEWLMPGWYIGRRLTQRGRGFTGGAYRNAEPLYDLPVVAVTANIVEGPLRVSALRSLGAYANIFAIESFMDELAEKAGMDPVVFRLRHLKDERARAVIEATATRAGWDGEKLPPGVGMGFARYKNSAAYCAVAVEAASPAPGRVRIIRAVSAVDAGQTINPDGLKNQIEGGIIQSASWTLMEEVKFDESGILSRDWATYPILRISDSSPVEVQVLDHPNMPPLGAGEASQGPAAAAVVNDDLSPHRRQSAKPSCGRPS